MADIQQLIEADKALLLSLNGSDSLFWDGFMWTVTDTKTWIPAVLVLLYVVFKNNRVPQGIVITLMWGGLYGFISSHAANTFAVAMFASLLVRYLPFTCMMFLWAMIPSYSRMYLGVHYPGDILCGAVAGSVVGVLVYLLYARLRKKFFDCPQYISTQYTKGGYTKDDISILHATLLLTYLYAIIGGMIVAKSLHF